MNHLKKYISKILIIFLLLAGVYITNQVSAEYIIPGIEKIEKVSNQGDITGNADNIQDAVENAGLGLLGKAKIVLQGIIILFIVYIGIQMIISMGSDEEKLSAAKRQLRYSIVAIIFINIPGMIFDALNPSQRGVVDKRTSVGAFMTDNTDNNIFINDFLFGQTFTDNILGFFKILIFAGALISFLIAGLKIIGSRGREEEITKQKAKIVYASLGLVFLGVVESWTYFAFEGSVKDGLDVFSSLANLALFFAGPTAIFFLTLAGYYYITANGEEDKVKKAKNIVINTVLATLILLAAYTFLLDLANI